MGVKKVCEVYLRTAKDHLEMADILFQNEKYSGVIFHLNQSVETGSKAFYEYAKISNESEFPSKIGHIITKGYHISVKNLPANIDKVNQSIVKENNENSFDIHSIEPQLNQADNMLSLMEKNYKQYKNIPEKRLVELLSWLESLNDELGHLKSECIRDPTFFNDCKRIDDEILHILYQKKVDRNILNGIKFSFQHYRFIFDKIDNPNKKADFLLNLVGVVIPLFSFSAVLQPHAIKTRYPSNGKTPEERYSMKKQSLSKHYPLESLLIKAAFEDLSTLISNF